MEMKQAIGDAMADVVYEAAVRLFCKEAKIHPDIYQVKLPKNGNTVYIEAPTLYLATLLYRTKGLLIAKTCRDWLREKAEIWSCTPAPITIDASLIDSYKSGAIMTHNSSSLPTFPWIGGRVEMTPTLYTALGEMMQSEDPMGLVVAETNIQIWVNPAAVKLFGLTSMEEAIPRDTTKDWLPRDLERKRQKVRDAEEGKAKAFEIDYSTRIGDGSWKRLVNRYQLVDNLYLIGRNIAEEIIEVPRSAADFS